MGGAAWPEQWTICGYTHQGWLHGPLCQGVKVPESFPGGVEQWLLLIETEAWAPRSLAKANGMVLWLYLLLWSPPLFFFATTRLYIHNGISACSLILVTTMCSKKWLEHGSHFGVRSASWNFGSSLLAAVAHSIGFWAKRRRVAGWIPVAHKGSEL